MLSLCFSAAHTTALAMNRGEQESLFRQSHDIRLQQDEKAHNERERYRHYSYGNIHQVSAATTTTNLAAQSANSRSFGTDDDLRPFGANCDDLVLSVLKTPLRSDQLDLHHHSQHHHHPHHQQQQQQHRLRTGGSGSALATPTPSPQSQCAYTALQGSEDELVDDIESAKETTELQHERQATSPRAFHFLRRFRGGAASRQPVGAAVGQHKQPAGGGGTSPPTLPKAQSLAAATRGFEAHHRRVPTPMRRKSRARTRSQADILDGVQPVNHGMCLKLRSVVQVRTLRTTRRRKLF